MIKILRVILKKLFYIAFILTVCLTPVKADATTLREVEGSLEINHTYKGNPIVGAKFKIYKVASVDDGLGFIVERPFEGLKVDYSKLEDKTEWYLLHDTLANYAKTNGIQEIQATKTDKNGKAVFSGLKKGLYLVIGEPLIVDNYKYEGSPFLVSLPYNDPTTDELIYNISVNTKIRRSPISEMSLEVQKKWVNDKKENRPDGIKVNLYNGNEIYDTVILKEENNWQHKWENLFNSENWTVIEEDVPEGYVVSYENYGSVVIITNTYNKKDTAPLPQTGQPLNRRILVNLTGVLCIVGGLFLRKSSI